jgi:hypothetical protein
MTMQDELSGLERRARAVLEESVAHVDARTRSRLNQARQAAIALAAGRARRPAWQGLHLMPVTGAAAAAVAIALVLFNFRPPSMQPRPDGAQPSFEVLDMLADDENMRMMEDEDDHSFYEWAAAEGAQSDAPPLRETGAEASS